MDWFNERWVKLYVRDTVTWKLLDWQARCVLLHMIRKVDRAGVIDVGRNGVKGLATLLELPVEVVQSGVTQLTAMQDPNDVPTVIESGTAFALPKFAAAQVNPDTRRKREERARRRDTAMDDVTDSHGQSRTVTNVLLEEKEKEKEKEKEREREREERRTASPSPPPQAPTCGSISGSTKGRTRAVPMPDDWRPSSSAPNAAAEAEATKRGVDLIRELKQLRDWALSKGIIRRDWDAQWRMWIRGAKHGNGHAKPKTTLEFTLERIAELEARDRDLKPEPGDS